MKVFPAQNQIALHKNPDEEIHDPEQVHVWVCDLDEPPLPVERSVSILSPLDCERVNRLKTRRLRNRFIAGRAFVRQVLGNLLEIHPRDLAFRTNTHGKPYLFKTGKLPGFATAPLRFNWSHSENILVLGVTFRAEIGVDVEIIKSDFDPIPVAESYFSAAEVRQLKSLPACEQLAAFFWHWTLREAFAKAFGLGVVQGLDQLEARFDADGSSSAAHSDLHFTGPGGWKFFQQTFMMGCASAAGAIVVRE